MLENPEKNSVYTVYSGDVGDLAEELTRFCTGSYGDRCEFYSVRIERADREGGSWNLHEYPSFDSDTVEAVRRHLKTGRDFVRIKFGGEDEDYDLEFIVSPARNASCLTRWVSHDDFQSFEEDDLVVLTVEKKREDVNEEQRRFIKGISDN